MALCSGHQERGILHTLAAWRGRKHPREPSAVHPLWDNDLEDTTRIKDAMMRRQQQHIACALHELCPTPVVREFFSTRLANGIRNRLQGHLCQLFWREAIR